MAIERSAGASLSAARECDTVSVKRPETANRPCAQMQFRSISSLRFYLDWPAIEVIVLKVWSLAASVEGYKGLPHEMCKSVITMYKPLVGTRHRDGDYRLYVCHSMLKTVIVQNGVYTGLNAHLTCQKL